MYIILVRWKKSKTKTIKQDINSDRSIEQKCTEPPPTTQESLVNEQKEKITKQDINSGQKCPELPQEGSVNEKKQKSAKRAKRPLQSQENVPPGKRYKTEKKPNPSVRFDQMLGHLPKIDKSRLVRCKNEGCDKKSYIICSACNVHLCICVNEERNCFEDIHTLKKADA